MGGKQKKMVKLKIEAILKEQKKSKEWLCNKMDISHYNLNKALKGNAKSISYKYIQGFCKYLNCTPNDIFEITYED